TDVPEITPEVTPTEAVTPNPNPITLPNNVPNIRITGATCGASGTFNNAYGIVELYHSGDYASRLLSALAPLNLDESTQSLLSQLSIFPSETSVVITYGAPYDPNNPTNMLTAIEPVALSPTGVFTNIQIPYTFQSAPPPNQTVYFNIKDVYARGIATQFVLMPFLDKYNAGYTLT
ncbi:MAG TPA: hypothetical protein PLZ51_23490, partial [Aggregatilineales bacterium]|nr:hypothetical protein [Aggregatilineales bacterium]